MKSFFYVLFCSMLAISLAASCTKDPATNESDKGPDNENAGDNGTDVTLPEFKKEALNASPSGASVDFEIEIEGYWTIEVADEYDWITVSETSGTGDAILHFTVEPNDSGKGRDATYYVKVGTYDAYEIFIIQGKADLPILDGDLEFVKWLVNNKAYGDATPVVNDWFAFVPEGFTGLDFGIDAGGKLYIDAINFTANTDNASTFFNAFPPTINLQNLTKIYVNYQTTGLGDGAMDVCPLKGSEFPREWNCPKLEKVHLERVGMVGTIPSSFAALPNLRALFIRSCDFYGALPHDWASDKLESVIIGFNGVGDCPNLGYMVPASLDVVLNSEKIDDGFFRDPNEFKLGGSRENWSGFERGWGQKRYVKFGGGTEDDLDSWSDFRGLTEGTAEEIAPGGIRNPLDSESSYLIDSWSGAFSLIKGIPTEMMDWDQGGADAYTAEAAKRERLYIR